MSEESSKTDTLRRQRDLYLRLLGLAKVDDVETLLRDALALAVAIADSHQGYLELYTDEAGKSWHLSHGFTDQETDDIQRRVSRGIIAEAVATGRTVVTPSARLDPRFSARDSIRASRIEAVLCVPIGTTTPRGVLYLQARDRRDFSESARSSVESFAEHLAPLVDRVLERVQYGKVSDLTEPSRAKLRATAIVGRSPALATMLEQAALVARLDVSVLLTGDSGTGKSQLARVIHDNSPRASSPFLEVNCAAIPEHLMESELFGALPGSHSTATRKIEGKVEATAGGTLFLDEIGELSLAAQAKVLQLLQSGEYYPLGATSPVRANVRILAATNSNLEQAVGERRFREDLFYRLHVVPIRAPSLAERRSDIAELAAHFCRIACERHRLPKLSLSPNAVMAAVSTEWPGNVRQLAHAIEAAAIRASGSGGVQIELSHLFPERSVGGSEPEARLTFQEATRQFQATLLLQALEENDWNVLETARRLDLARSHVYNLIRAFNLTRTDKSS